MCDLDKNENYFKPDSLTLSKLEEPRRKDEEAPTPAAKDGDAANKNDESDECDA